MITHLCGSEAKPELILLFVFVLSIDSDKAKVFFMQQLKTVVDDRISRLHSVSNPSRGLVQFFLLREQ